MGWLAVSAGWLGDCFKMPAGINAGVGELLLLVCGVCILVVAKGGLEL